MTTEIYLDANATSSVLPAAIAAAAFAMREGYGNPSSAHACGVKARAMLDAVRHSAQRVLGVGPGRLLFTSGATEGIQTAVLSALCAIRARRQAGLPVGQYLLYGATEHKAVPESLAHWNDLLDLKLTLRALPVDGDGRHDLAALRALAPDCAMLCTMAANNETGSVSELAAIEAVLLASASTAYWMVDSVQALGKLALNLCATRIDYAPFSGHKLYAPKGVGMLYVREGSPLTPLMMGGGQEGGLRSGTENMSGIAALGAVLAALEDGHTFRSHAQMTGMRDRIADALRLALPGIVFNTPFAHALPSTLNFSVPGFASGELLDLFDAAGVRVSAGSACSSAKAAPSYVLEAMGLPAWRCGAAVRMSFGPLVDEAFIDAACARIARCGAALRAAALIDSEQGALRDAGLIQLGCDGACSWLVTDPDSGSVIIIDARAELCARIATYVRCQRYRVRAMLDTGVDSGGAAARASLRHLLAGQFDHAASADANGWPDVSEPIMLGDATLADGLRIGARVLVRLGAGPGAGISYLLGTCNDGRLDAQDVQFAFTGAGMLPGGLDDAMPIATLRSAVQRLATLMHGATLLCPSHDAQQRCCSTLATEAHGRGALAGLLALQPRLAGAALPAMDGVMQLDAGALARFLATHPDAQLIDVREVYEHAAGAAQTLGGRTARNVPLSQLAAQLAHWLSAPQRPLVLYCRSGKRSARAAQLLHRLGYQNAWHVTGCIAQAGAAELAIAA